MKYSLRTINESQFLFYCCVYIYFFFFWFGCLLYTTRICIHSPCMSRVLDYNYERAPHHLGSKVKLIVPVKGIPIILCSQFAILRLSASHCHCESNVC